MAERGEDFSDYVWGFVDNKPIVNQLDHWRNVQAKTPLSEQIAKDMKKRGFKFCGPVIVYAVHAGHGHGQRPRGALPAPQGNPEAGKSRAQKLILRPAPATGARLVQGSFRDGT